MKATGKGSDQEDDIMAIDVALWFIVAGCIAFVMRLHIDRRESIPEGLG